MKMFGVYPGRTRTREVRVVWGTMTMRVLLERRLIGPTAVNHPLPLNTVINSARPAIRIALPRFA